MIVSPQLAASKLSQFFVSEPTVRMSVQRRQPRTDQSRLLVAQWAQAVGHTVVGRGGVTVVVSVAYQVHVVHAMAGGGGNALRPGWPAMCACACAAPVLVDVSRHSRSAVFKVHLLSHGERLYVLYVAPLHAAGHITITRREFGFAGSKFWSTAIGVSIEFEIGVPARPAAPWQSRWVTKIFDRCWTPTVPEW